MLRSTRVVGRGQASSWEQWADAWVARKAAYHRSRLADPALAHQFVDKLDMRAHLPLQRLAGAATLTPVKRLHAAVQRRADILWQPRNGPPLRNELAVRLGGPQSTAHSRDTRAACLVAPAFYNY